MSKESLTITFESLKSKDHEKSSWFKARRVSTFASERNQNVLKSLAISYDGSICVYLSHASWVGSFPIPLKKKP